MYCKLANEKVDLIIMMKYFRDLKYIVYPLIRVPWNISPQWSLPLIILPAAGDTLDFFTLISYTNPSRRQTNRRVCKQK